MKYEQPQLPFEPSPHEKKVHEIVAHGHAVARALTQDIEAGSQGEGTTSQQRVQLGSAKMAPVLSHDPNGYRLPAKEVTSYGSSNLSAAAQNSLKIGDGIYLSLRQERARRAKRSR